MPRIDVIFLLLATLCLIVGVSLGIGMGLTRNFQLAPVHAHLNLLGWASLALYGLSYRAYPALGRSRLGIAHLIAAAPAAVLFPLGIYLAMAHETIGPALAGAFIWLAGALIFLVNLVRAVVLRASTTPSVIPSEIIGRDGASFGPVLSERAR